MPGCPSRRAAKGFFLILAAAFLLLAAFVTGIQGVIRPSTGRIILAVVALIAAVLLLRLGNDALRPTPDPEGESDASNRADP